MNLIVPLQAKHRLDLPFNIFLCNKGDKLNTLLQGHLYIKTFCFLFFARSSARLSATPHTKDIKQLKPKFFLANQFSLIY